MAKMAKHLAPTYEALAVIKCHDADDRDELAGTCRTSDQEQLPPSNLPTNTSSSDDAAAPPEWNDCSPPRSPSSPVRSHPPSPCEDLAAPPSSPPRQIDKPAAGASRPLPAAPSAMASSVTATAPLAPTPIQWEKMVDISSMRTFGGSAIKPPARNSYLTTGMPPRQMESSCGSEQPLTRPTHLLPKSNAVSAEPSRFTWGQLQPGVPSGGRRSRAPPAPVQQNGSVKFDWVKMVPPKKLV